MCASSEKKLKERGEVIFDEMIYRVSGARGEIPLEGVALSLSMWLLRCVVEWKEV